MLASKGDIKFKVGSGGGVTQIAEFMADIGHRCGVEDRDVVYSA
tara:strand:- start:293 stop:424 length:132 start_codon:yes stop_codon:yes gene_type:complete